jgi:hypothetical protein
MGRLVWVSAARTDDREAALALLDAGPLRQIARTDEYFPIVLANSLAPLGEIDEALAWLDQSISWTFVEPGFHRLNPNLELWRIGSRPPSRQPHDGPRTDGPRTPCRPRTQVYNHLPRVIVRPREGAPSGGAHSRVAVAAE